MSSVIPIASSAARRSSNSTPSFSKLASALNGDNSSSITSERSSSCNVNPARAVLQSAALCRAALAALGPALAKRPRANVFATTTSEPWNTGMRRACILSTLTTSKIDEEESSQCKRLDFSPRSPVQRYDTLTAHTSPRHFRRSRVIDAARGSPSFLTFLWGSYAPRAGRLM